MRSPIFRSRNRGFLGFGYREPGGKSDPRRVALIGLLITVLLVVGGVYLVRVLRQMSQVQDCVMSGRSNCAPIKVQ